jgi:hypothetical protein
VGHGIDLRMKPGTHWSRIRGKNSKTRWAVEFFSKPDVEYNAIVDSCHKTNAIKIIAARACCMRFLAIIRSKTG